MGDAYREESVVNWKERNVPVSGAAKSGRTIFVYNSKVIVSA
jgi:hypothetical protein